jgi:hypothetical protein
MSFPRKRESSIKSQCEWPTSISWRARETALCILVYSLVYYEESPDMVSAITREKQLKKWNRQWKIELIEETNPEWKDLYPCLF